MINKQGLWFLTLFSLILVLSVYYITMPSELLMNEKSGITSKKDTTTSKNKSKVNSKTKLKATSKTKEDKDIKESSSLETMRVEDDEAVNKEIESLQVVLNDDKSSVDEKNKAYDKMKEINNNKAEEDSLEDKIQKEFELESYVKIEGNKIKVVINSSEHDVTLANKIMRMIQGNYKDNKYITVKFQK